MTHRVYLDFETRSAADIRQVGSWMYSRHETTNVLCLAYAVDDGPIKLIKGTPIIDENVELPDDLAFAIAHGHELWAHNAQFERHIWRNVLNPAPTYWPRIPLNWWRCSAAQAARWGLPRSLEEAARHLRLRHQKDKIGHRLMMKLSRPRRLKDTSKIHWHEDPEELQRLYEYCKQDVEVERQIAKKLPELEPEELAFWQWTEDLNDRGIGTDQGLVSGILKVVEQLDARDLASFRELTNGQVESPRQVAALKTWLAQEQCYLSDLQARTVQDVLDGDKLSQKSRLALEARQNLSKSSLAKLTALRDRADIDGRVRAHLMYFGAHTGRLSGRGVQTQNLPAAADKKIKAQLEPAVDIFKTGDLKLSETLLSDVRKTASLSIRSALKADEGKVFVAADYAAIEARGLLWLAKAPQLDILRNGGNLYIEMAQRIYDRPIDKYDDPLEYDMGKRAILGLGYGMGAEKFRQTAKKYGVEISEDFAQSVVAAYRDWIVEVPSFWRKIERAFFQALEGRTAELDHNMRVEYRQNTLRWYLPSGRPIIYWYPRIVDHETSWGEIRPQIRAFMQGREATLYGGLQTENGTQALCRDLLRDAALKIQRERPEYKAVLTVHDELVYEVHKADLDWVCQTMSSASQWAKNLPVAAEGWVDVRYKK